MTGSLTRRQWAAVGVALVLAAAALAAGVGLVAHAGPGGPPLATMRPSSPASGTHSGSGTHAGSGTVTGRTAGKSGPSEQPVAGWAGHGAVAFVGDGALVVIDNGGTEHRVGGTDPVSSPEWSPGAQWVAFLRSAPAPGFGQGPSRLWVVRPDGTGARALTPAGADVVDFAWDPAGGNRLAVVTTTTTGGSPALLLAGVSGPAVPLLSSGLPPVLPGPESLSWSPDGRTLAVTTAARGASGPEVGRIQLVPVAGGPARSFVTAAGDTYDLAGWWPDGKGLLYWTDPQGSASIAADGLLLSSQATGGPARPLATTLVHPGWVAWSPDGGTVAVVAGGYRAVWDRPRRLLTCSVATGACAAVGQPAGSVVTDPAWTAAGLVADVAPAASSPSGVPAGLDPSGPPFSPANVRAWYGAHRLAAAGPGGLRPVAGWPPGAHAAMAVRGGTVCVAGDQLWLPSGAGSPSRLGAAIGPASVYGESYYGYIDWRAQVAWAA